MAFAERVDFSVSGNRLCSKFSQTEPTARQLILLGFLGKNIQCICNYFCLGFVVYNNNCYYYVCRIIVFEMDFSRLI